MVDYDGNIEDKSDCVRIMMNEALNNLEMEESIVISNIESAIINNNFKYEVDYKNYEIGNICSKLKIDESMSRFKMCVGSRSTMRKEYFEEESVVIAPIEVTTKYSDADGDSLTNVD